MRFLCNNWELVANHCFLFFFPLFVERPFHKGYVQKLCKQDKYRIVSQNYSFPFIRSGIVAKHCVLFQKKEPFRTDLFWRTALSTRMRWEPPRRRQRRKKACCWVLPWPNKLNVMGNVCSLPQLAVAQMKSLTVRATVHKFLRHPLRSLRR